MPQLASRLLVRNKELYGRYDRFVSEASFRINVAIPLGLLLGTAVWLSDLWLGWKILLSALTLTAALLLLRQGFLRAILARDVIAQALAIGEVESKNIEASRVSDEPPMPDGGPNL